MSIDWQMKRKKLDELMTMDKLTGWLKDQPPGGEYVWSDPVNCLMGKYLAEHDVEWGTGAYSELPNYEEIAGTQPWTFGAALERAQELKALPPPPLQIEALQQMEPIEVRELIHETAAPGDVRELASERYPDAGDGAAATSS